MARKKASDGVQATIERLTSKSPCPTYLRDTLNKYLYQEQLFEGARRGALRKLGKLCAPATDNLVHNLLDLDALFGGETTLVVDLMTGALDANKLTKTLDNVEQIMRQRLQIYTYWLDRMPSVRNVLGTPGMDLKVNRLDERLSVFREDANAKIPPFALHALQLQEASEAKGRTGPPSSAEYVERAEAYLALDDLVNADRNACSAIEQDPACARGWFVRVAIALRRRYVAMRAYQSKRMEAQEFAEPLSEHERWALQQADEAAGDALAHQRSLDQILPRAILNWPQAGGRRDHPDLWKQVQNIFINRMFEVAVHGTERTVSWRQLAHMNGLEPEWELEHLKYQYGPSIGLGEEALFAPEETQAINALLNIYDANPRQFFDSFDVHRIANDFRLYHLRYVLRTEDGDAHWKSLQAKVEESPVTWQADNLMRDADVAKLWQAHYCRQEQATALIQFYTGWLGRMQTQNNDRLYYSMLRQFAYLYHHQFARHEFSLCGEVTAKALALFEDATALRGWFGLEQHPYDESISMPISRARYWEYLAAIAAVEQRKEGGVLSEHARAILASAGDWQKSFSKESDCFWTRSEEYEEGGGEDWPEPPYQIDLRKAENWAMR